MWPKYVQKRYADFVRQTKPKSFDEGKKLISQEMPDHLKNPPFGVMKDIVRHYDKLSTYRQIFGTHTALSICSVLLGRKFCSDRQNTAMLYLCEIAETGQGKDLALNIAKKVLQQCGGDVELGTEENKLSVSKFVGRGGVNSDASIYTELNQRPCFLIPWDEIGKD